MSNNLLRLPEAMQKTGLTRSSVYRLLNSGDFPHPVKLGRAIAFSAAEIDEWIGAKLAARDQERAA